MSRQEQIYKKAEGDCIAMLESIERGDIIKGSICPQSYRAGFMDGAKWADQHPAWVSVEEELPEVGEKVIFYSPDLDDWLSGAIQSDGRWWSEEYASHFTDVPLWMKPQLPRKD